MVFPLHLAAVLAAGLFVALAWTSSLRAAESPARWSWCVRVCLPCLLEPLSQNVDNFRAERIQSRSVPIEQQELWDLKSLALARRLADWMFEQFAADARGAVAEVGAGIGTFSERLLAAEVERLLLIEPEPTCVEALRARFGNDPRVRVVQEEIPGAASLVEAPDSFDFVLCQNVLEHVHDDAAAVDLISQALRPGGRLGLLVPAGPRLCGPLDRAYGHERRYTDNSLRKLMEERDSLRLLDLYPFNLLGIPGWWAKNRVGATSLGTRSLAVYEALVPLWRPLERRLRPPWGLSLIAHAERV
jgi:SAM-dependent methyltransferase